MFQCLRAHSNFIHHDPAAWHLTLTDAHAELLDGCLDAVDLLCEPAVQSPLRHCLSVQSLQTAGDSLEQGLVALSGHTNTRAAGKKASWGHYWKRFSENTTFLPNYLSKNVSAFTWGNKTEIQLQNCASFYMSSYLHPYFRNLAHETPSTSGEVLPCRFCPGVLAANLSLASSSPLSVQLTLTCLISSWKIML